MSIRPPRRRRAVPFGTGCMLLLAAAACDGEAAPDASAFTAIDSAGIRLVRYAGDPAGQGPTVVASPPVWSHGHGPEDYHFSTIAVGALLPDGGAVVADRMNQELLRIGPDGALAGVLARAGRGPQEVLQVMGIEAPGDETLLVQDAFKLMRFEAGELADVETFGAVPSLRSLRMIGLDPDGRPLLATSRYIPGFEEPWLQGHLAGLRLDPLAVDTLAAFDLAERAPSMERYNPFRIGGRAVVSDGRFVVARGDLPRLVWRDADGAVVQILRWNPVLRYPTEEEFEAYRVGMADGLRRANPQASDDQLQAIVQRGQERVELHTDVPYPLWQDLQDDGEGGVWLGLFDPVPGPDVSLYDRVAADGTWRGRVVLPDGARVLDVEGDRVLVVLPDAMEVEAVALLELEPGS